MIQNSESCTAEWDRLAKVFQTLQAILFSSHKFLFCFLIHMCCFCQITEIRSVCHLWVWPLSLVNAFGHLCCCQKPHFRFHSKVDAAVVCHESGTEAFSSFLLTVPWTKDIWNSCPSHIYLLLQEFLFSRINTWSFEQLWWRELLCLCLLLLFDHAKI